MAAGARTARRRGREFALQALYAWQLSGAAPADLVTQMKEREGLERADVAFAERLVRGVIADAEALRPQIAACAARSFDALSPVERAILYIGAWELSRDPETPFKVVLNEAVELGKSFGGEGGHRFVNGALEKLAADLRPAEVALSRRATA